MDNAGIKAAANSVRSLSMDAIQAAGAGHPGIPLGAAELAPVLYGEVLKHNPTNPRWPDRDRFIMSAGHGSLWLYSVLHLAGYNITIDDIKSFHHIDSKCSGHPEYGRADGVENTSGPLGQGIAMAVGSAIAETMLAARFNTAAHTIVDHYTYSLVGEGCLEEGVSSEASSLAGHLKLGKLIVFYDENDITLDGPTSLAFTEDIAKRYEAYGWQVLRGSMYDEPQKIVNLVNEAKACSDKPSLVMLKSIIGKYAPKQGTSAVHGAALGEDGVKAAKEAIGLPVDKSFYVVPGSYEYFAAKKAAWAEREKNWQNEFDAWAKENPELKKEWDAFHADKTTADVPDATFKVGELLATRDASNKQLNVLAKRYGNLVGGSADLMGPNRTKLEDGSGVYSPENRDGRMIMFGIREFAMSAISAGISLHGGLRPFCATFLVFSDYLRPSLRIVALMGRPVIYVFSHDSIYVGADGPTHQPVEMLAAIRAIPNVQVLRPGDAEETVEAWNMAYENKDHPVCIALCRQPTAVYEKADADWKRTMRRGAYVVQKGGDNPDITVLASGSEVDMALKASPLFDGKTVRVVSVSDLTLFAKQDKAFREKIIGNARHIVAVEAGVGTDWLRFVRPGNVFCIDRFGEAGEASEVVERMHFTVRDFVAFVKNVCVDAH